LPIVIATEKRILMPSQKVILKYEFICSNFKPELFLKISGFPN